MNWNHGGDVVGYQREFGIKPLDFSASLNPFGMPEQVAEAARRAVDGGVAYPDPFCRDLAAALAARLRVPPTALFFGNGASEVIYRLVLARRPRRALLPVPSFAEYELALESCGCTLDFHYLDAKRDFVLDETLLERITPDIDMLFLCQPNNPTGKIIPVPLLRDIMECCKRRDTTLVLDECFLPFVDDARELSVVTSLAENTHVAVVGSFTKLYAMAGLRLGYAVSHDEALLTAVRRAGPPWSVSTIAQAAGLAALEEDAYVSASLAAIREEKAFLRRELSALGANVVGSAANYIFFRCARGDLAKALSPRGILIRDCANFRGLEPGYYRVAIGTRDANRRLLDAFADIGLKE